LLRILRLARTARLLRLLKLQKDGERWSWGWGWAECFFFLWGAFPSPKKVIDRDLSMNLVDFT
jgi:hypothetical protein